jgi:hypothetical protein
MPNRDQLLLTVLDRNPQIHLAYITHQPQRPALHLHSAGFVMTTQLIVPLGLEHLHQIVHVTQPAGILRCPDHRAQATNPNQQCQDEPIKCGTQIQPAGKNWLGTAGAPVRWLDKGDTQRFGILSNWHVMADGAEQIGHAQHQPDTSKPAMATLAEWSAVTCCQTMYVDAAIADAKMDGFHTIDDQIIGIGRLNPARLTATEGLAVTKSGRTTSITNGRVVSVGAAVKVGYDGFTATFADQIVIEGINGDFSAGGDSGSLVVDTEQHRPVGLLFAGGGGQTIANPIAKIMGMWDLDFALRE